MSAAFEKLPQEKREKIITVAIEEFIKNGYDKTTTGSITEKAGISKGILFHYFGSKKNLYIYLVEYVYEFLKSKNMERFVKIQKEDFFERIKRLVLNKQKIVMQYYNESRFIIAAIGHPPLALKTEMEEIYQRAWKFYEEEEIQYQVYVKELISSNCLREHIPAETLVKFTKMVLEQFSMQCFIRYKNKQIDLEKEMESMVKELDAYIDIIKYGIYKS